MRRFASEEITRFVTRRPATLARRQDPRYTRLSVVVPSYNQASFLERTLLSILNHDYPNLELLVLDGGSNDGSREIIERYAPAIDFWVSERDGGQAAAINSGFARATGAFVAWQNADDLYLPGFFHRVHETVARMPQTDLVFANCYGCDEDEQILWATQYTPFSLPYLLYVDWNLTSQAVFLRRELVAEAGPLREDISVGFDWDWFIRVGKRARHPALIGDYGGCYRIQPEAKLAVFPAERRRAIEVDILRSHGVTPRDDARPFYQHWPWRTFRLRAWRRLERELLYSGSAPARLAAPFYRRLRRWTGHELVGF